ncbi:hypothetical protein [Jiella sonneratiae]|uniref:Uncharacterized protein n=1 Tax=Jiella sonneratiae TaxID=2816856 RepID=A0ABS3J4Y3_9HYPH|nr:hypothetical protein [Jiella sonneratiae]MBO0904734.1 hypothetical protein [Jiella sonneratiae]
MQEPSLAVRLTGTEEIVAPPRLLRAGRLSAELDAGNLRAIRHDGIEIIRAVSFIVRDENWGTYNASITDLSVEEDGETFAVRYEARAGEPGRGFRYRAEIVGTPRSVTFRGRGSAEGAFVTNRTGFVVLHPVKGVAGSKVTIEHVDGSIEDGRFPEIIDPLQPMMDLRALTHEPVPGLKVVCRMEGDTFEMEDQRNWTDASYKTYVRPLGLPWPYRLTPADVLDQTVTIGIEGEAESTASGGAAGPVRIALDGEAGPAPRLGIGLQAGEIAATEGVVETLATLQPAFLVYHHDPRACGAAELAAAADIARRIGAEAWLDLVVAEVEDFAGELAGIGRQAAEIGDPFAVVRVSPAADMKGTLPGSPWPPAAPLDALYRAARSAFPKARIGGGMFSFFTELNRKRPPLDDLDLVGFTTAAIVHAGDDRTVFESLEALPYVARSARAIAGDRPVVAGPSAIGMRLNPYGAAPMENPGNIRQAMNRNDPRQRGLIGVAFTLGYYAVMAEEGLEAVAFGGTTGAQGVVATPQDWPQPHFDAAGGVFPVFHVERALARLAGRRLHAVGVDDPARVLAVAAAGPDGIEMLIANLTPQAQTVGLPAKLVAAKQLDAEGFVAACGDPAFLDGLAPASGTELSLGAYAVARLFLQSPG